MGTHVWLTYNKIRLYSSYSHFIVQRLRPAAMTDYFHTPIEMLWKGENSLPSQMSVP